MEVPVVFYHQDFAKTPGEMLREKRLGKETKKGLAKIGGRMKERLRE